MSQPIEATADEMEVNKTTESSEPATNSIQETPHSVPTQDPQSNDRLQEAAKAQPAEAHTDATKTEGETTAKAQTNDTEKENEAEPEVEDILGSGKLLRKVLTTGKGHDTRPKMGDKVTVHFTSKLADGLVVEKGDTMTFVIGDGDYLQLFDLVSPLMQMGEVSLVTSESTFAYGDMGRKPDIPPKAKMEFEIRMIENHGQVDYTTMNLQEITDEADKKRERGNFHYSRQEYTGAVNSYTKAINITEALGASHDASPEILQAIVDLRLKCFNNLAASQLKLEAFAAAVKSCDNVLSIQPENVKALFRKGKCLTQLGDIKDAIATLKKGLKVEPDNRSLHNELSRLTNQLKNQEEKERKIYKRMFGQEKEKPKASSGWSSWSWAAGAAGAAVAVSLGLATYRYFHS